MCIPYRVQHSLSPKSAYTHSVVIAGSVVSSPVFCANQWGLQLSSILPTTHLALTQTSGSCSLVQVTYNDPHQAHLLPRFLCLAVCTTDWFCLSHIPFSSDTGQWGRRLVEPTQLHCPAHICVVRCHCVAIPIPVLFSSSPVRVATQEGGVHCFPTEPNLTSGFFFFPLKK